MPRADNAIANQTTKAVIPKVVRMTVIQRDLQRCVHCASASSLEFDYLVPPTKGGAAVLGNLQLLCASCMRLKHQGR
ncbi:hypothetical protein DKM44_03835 [Deinococcus irradiatisoli]|uniref:HNH domain-containing protein n=1 Tax=Deinococcus irradiatisoli TaxID=2202254 RepID=A0A2Z3JBF2_9DEIO|nr:hypothetical protein DKM44_03835 [Deinococcus irradiatisoli]